MPGGFPGASGVLFISIRLLIYTYLVYQGTELNFFSFLIKMILLSYAYLYHSHLIDKSMASSMKLPNIIKVKYHGYKGVNGKENYASVKE